MKRIILWVSIFLNLLAGLWLIHKLQHRMTADQLAYDQTAHDSIWNRSRSSTLKLLPIDSSDIVFIGNSITEGFPLQEMFHTLHIKNRGISGNRSCHILGRIEEIARAHPAKVFLDIGINDILSHVPLDTLKINYQKILNIILTESQDTRIYIQSVFPLGKEHAPEEKTVEEFNAWLKAYCQQGDFFTYIDLFSAFYKDGLLDPAFTYDDLHLNGRGYQVWKQEIIGYIFKPALTMLDN